MGLPFTVMLHNPSEILAGLPPCPCMRVGRARGQEYCTTSIFPPHMRVARVRRLCFRPSGSGGVPVGSATALIRRVFLHSSLTQRAIYPLLEFLMQSSLAT